MKKSRLQTDSNWPPWLSFFLIMSSLSGACQGKAQSSNSIEGIKPTSQYSEGFFRNGSSYALISEHWLPEPGSLLGFSFRSCAPGELLRQMGDNQDELRLSLNAQGYLVLRLTSDNQQRPASEAIVQENLLDSRWHTVILSVDSESSDLSVNVSNGGGSAFMSGQIVRALNFSALSPQLRVGGGTVACIREGPGVRFTQSGLQVNSFAVHWIEPSQTCLLPTTCSAYDWSVITGQDGGASCEDSDCENGGLCLPGEGIRANPSPGTVACLCPLGFTSANCGDKMTSCAENPCQNGASCTDDPSGGTGYKCHCDGTGYRGRYCEIEASTCESDACRNGGTCLKQPGGFICQCPAQYGGMRCDNARAPRLSSNPCLSAQNPCLNNGTCFYSPQSNKLTCMCTEGFSGSRCEVDLCARLNCPSNSECIKGERCECLPGYLDRGGADSSSSGLVCEEKNECEASPCRNGGTCIDGDNAYECNCRNGFMGLNCENPIDYCAKQNPCLNGGKCRSISETASTLCVCPDEFTGEFCQDDVDECIVTSANPCQHGSCINTHGGYHCQCEAGWTGENCQENSNLCELQNPCVNAGTCVPKVDGGYGCQCLPGYSGNLCQINIDECASNPCVNGGNCTDGINGYSCSCPAAFDGPTCQCTQGFTGDNCSEKINECDAEPCQNNATCVSLQDGYRCDCDQGWTGVLCDQDIDECELDKDICNNGVCFNVQGTYNCFCRPGFTGDHCSEEFDECLARPCQNNGTCFDMVNGYRCTCAPGYEGVNCETDIDECATDPCQNNATCIDKINEFTCICQAGFTGRQCQTDIDDCESDPCGNGGQCIDGINEYSCNCTDTGFEGAQCQINIDECALGRCTNNATCIDGINDYTCNCFPGYQGKDCQEDVAECSEEPCKHGGLCFEKSNITLYDPALLSFLPTNVRGSFDTDFSYEDAAGYLCSCADGYEGINCEIDIDECLSSPCQRGECINDIAKYTCVCPPGFQGENCGVEIDECTLYNDPCEHGACIDREADYKCVCQEGWGGKNCSVALTGCKTKRCLNDGVCAPWLVGEDDHRFNCTCVSGFDGQLCQHRTTFSLSGNSYIKVSSNRTEGYELHMRFRTTLGNGLVAIGIGNKFFNLQLVDGRLVLKSNMISRYEGLTIGGEVLNNTKWQKVYVAVNASHLTLGINDRVQRNEPTISNGDLDTVFHNTYFGGIEAEQRILARDAPFLTGCVQDIIVDAKKITEEDFQVTDASGSGGQPRDVEQVNTSAGCPRKPQCQPNPCQSNGICTDLWNSFQCTCHRPFLGPSCEFNYTGGTFGHESTNNSIAIVDIDNPLPYSSGVDISMFIRTRKEDGYIFYFGSDLAIPDKDGGSGQPKSYITGQIKGGKLVVHVSFEGKTEKFVVYTQYLADGYRHFIQVARMKNAMMVKVNETSYINHEIPAPTSFTAQKLYLGNYPSPTIIPKTTTTTTTTTMSTTEQVSTQRFSPPASTSSPSSISPRRLDNNPQSTTTEIAAASAFNNGIFEDEIVSNEDLSSSSLNNQDTNQITNANGIVIRRQRRAVEDLEILSDNQLNNQASQVPYFKGIIQDVQISDGGDVVRIIELFEDIFDVSVQKPNSIGKVELIAVEKGVVSDDACAVNPCQNEGSCQVTWNDYHCQCQDGYRGQDCAEKEYCFWYECPLGSTCNSLDDGHECISNATFNGVNSTILVYPQLSVESENFVNASNEAGNEADNEIMVTLRSRSRKGTLLQITNANGEFIRLSWQEEKLVVDVPEVDGQMHSYFLDSIHPTSDAADSWHTVTIRFYDGIVSAYIDNQQDAAKQFTIDFPPNLSLLDFVLASSVIVGSGFVTKNGSASESDLYSLVEDTAATTINPPTMILNAEFGDHFRGCLGPVRIAGILVPYFNEAELKNNSASKRFDIESRLDVVPSECVLCYEHECLNGGSCANPNEDFECSCATGFSGSLCVTNIDDCISHDCRNGQCVDSIANYTCACDPGWTGWLCDEDLDECLSGPCLHGGSCQQTPEPGSYNCSCTDQYKGQNCEQKRNRTCADDPCQHGSCYPEQNDDNGEFYKCDCIALYNGVDCHKKRDFCEESWQPCQNGATCTSIDSTLTYSCTCPPGFTGRNCEEDIDECADNPCNGGNCTNLLNDYQCNCQDTGFTGDFCQNDINECIEDQPCKQGACQNLDGSYRCDCFKGYCGTNCQREDPCQLNDGLCKNQGICIPSCDEFPFYQCRCTEEWEGRNCTIKSSRQSGDIALIVGPVVGGMLFIAIVGVLVFLIMARRKRRSEGKYKPASQELTSPRLQLDNIIKPPPEERLI